MKSLTLLLIIGSLFTAISACRKDKTEEPNEEFECDYGESFSKVYDFSKKQDGLIPMSFYNYWVYADTIWSTDGTLLSTTIDTVKITYLRKTEGDLWWSIEGRFPARNIHLNDNKVYSLQSGITGCKYQSLLYYEATADTTFDSGGNGDIAIPRKVYKSGSVINTPAGDFEDCTVYAYGYDFASADYVILKPGIGIVKFSYGDYNGGYSERTLIEYHIE